MREWLVSASCMTASAPAARPTTDPRWRLARAAVALDAAVDDPAVARRKNRDQPRPVDRKQRGLKRGQMRIGHAHQAALNHRGLEALGITEPELPDEHGPAQVEFLMVFEELDIGDVEPPVVLEPERDWKPVGEVDDRLVLHWRDRNARWHRHELTEPTHHILDLIAEIDNDPTGIFCAEAPVRGESGFAAGDGLDPVDRVGGRQDLEDSRRFGLRNEVRLGEVDALKLIDLERP
jgi:Protein of unknown function (DUF3024)